MRSMRFLTCGLFVFCLTIPSILAQAQDKDTVSILGEVQQAGSFKVNEPISLFDALKLVKGFTPYSNRHAIVITHNGMTRRVDFDSIATGKASMIQIEPGDTVVVFRILRSHQRAR